MENTIDNLFIYFIKNKKCKKSQVMEIIKNNYNGYQTTEIENFLIFNSFHTNFVMVIEWDIEGKVKETFNFSSHKEAKEYITNEIIPLRFNCRRSLTDPNEIEISIRLKEFNMGCFKTSINYIEEIINEVEKFKTQLLTCLKDK